MCDLFWQSSPADEQAGDLSDVVRASLRLQQQHAPRRQPEPAADDMASSYEYDHLELQKLEQATSSMVSGQLHALMQPQLGDHQQQLHMSTPMPPPMIKRSRKSQTKKVVCIPAPTAARGGSGGGGETVPSDLWAWRKYGQKPIKGSPYPRGYYRCSSSKGCSARKQVERCRTDPTMLVVTYTSDHNHPWPTHRNTLAGSTRPPPPAAAANSNSNKPPPSAAAADQQLDLDLFAAMDIFNSGANSASKLQLEQEANADTDSKHYYQGMPSSLFEDPLISFGFFD